jgi:hypothetical protein
MNRYLEIPDWGVTVGADVGEALLELNTVLNAWMEESSELQISQVLTCNF